jgi:hypothetical protein
MSEGLSIILPLIVDSESGPYGLHKDIDSVAKQHMKMIILTAPGERVMDNNFGVGIRNYLFEPATPFIKDDIQNRIRSQVAKYLPFVNILKIEIDMNPDAGSLFLSINYTVPGSGIINDLTIPVSA